MKKPKPLTTEQKRLISKSLSKVVIEILTEGADQTAIYNCIYGKIIDHVDLDSVICDDLDLPDFSDDAQEDIHDFSTYEGEDSNA